MSRLRDLANLGAMLEERALARLAGARAARAALEARIAGLVAGESTNPGPAEFSGATARHARWVEAQRRALMPRLALAAAEEEAARMAARRAFGRARALEKLAKG